MLWFTRHSEDESLEKQVVDSESGGVERENRRVDLEVFKFTFNFILLSHTPKLWVTETWARAPVVLTRVGWSVELLMLS